ncbi:E3 ubiquitin-protein ligase TRIM37-like [Ochlerotatus camptorhynchus]|uniref:E3 ubiquitin-protein ligase TRIM37-like n=1 Tax=Ochlerotatus camptorhynchus TaxID=644619 RepID=UPI0031D0B66A
MSSQDKFPDSELSLLLECSICLGVLRDCRMCPDCSHSFCRECVERWLLQQSTCPYCRCSMQTNRLVKVYLINQLVETVQRQLAEEIRNRCPAHEKHQLLLACLRCKQSVCVDCWFSDGHVEHKDQVVPLGIAYEHFYRQTMQNSKDASGDSGPNEAASLRDKMAVLFDGKRDAASLGDILEIMEKLRIDDKN